MNSYLIAFLLAALLVGTPACNFQFKVGSCYLYDNVVWRITALRGLTLVYLESTQGKIALDAQVVRYFPEAECPAEKFEELEIRYMEGTNEYGSIQ